MKTYKFLLTISCLIFFSTVIIGQETKPIPFSQIRFSLGINGYQPLKIENFGEKLIKSRPMPGTACQITFHQSLFKQGYGLNLGLGLEFDPFNIGYKFDTPKGSNLYSGPNDAGFDSFMYIWINQAIYTLPLGIEKRFDNKYFKSTLEFGLKLNKLVAYPYVISKTDLYQTVQGEGLKVFSFAQYETKEYFLTYYVKAGINEFGKRKAWKLNLVAQYSPTVIGSGSFQFKELGFESYGTTKQRNNYLGVELVYNLTLLWMHVFNI